MSLPVAARPSSRPVPSGRAARRRRAIGLLVAAAILGAAVVVSIAVGSNALDPAEVWHALASPTGTLADQIVLDLRMFFNFE